MVDPRGLGRLRKTGVTIIVAAEVSRPMATRAVTVGDVVDRGADRHHKVLLRQSLDRCTATCHLLRAWMPSAEGGVDEAAEVEAGVARTVEARVVQTVEPEFEEANHCSPDKECKNM